MASDDLWKGKRVVWRHVPRGGYGFALLLPVTILGLICVTRSRAQRA